MGLLRFYRRPLLSAEKARILVDAVASKVPGKDGVIDEVVTEAVFYVETATGSLDAAREYFVSLPQQWIRDDVTLTPGLLSLRRS